MVEFLLIYLLVGALVAGLALLGAGGYQGLADHLNSDKEVRSYTGAGKRKGRQRAVVIGVLVTVSLIWPWTAYKSFKGSK